MTDFRSKFQSLRSELESAISSVLDDSMPWSLMEPSRYVLGGGGKRIRPVLVLLACEACGGKLNDAIHAAVAVEILHNFTLVHDDIMDNAHQRRGNPTVHERWDTNVAILVGDELIGIAYRELLKTKTTHVRELVSSFTTGMIEVCEGQAFDKEFETRSEVTLEEYFMMIEKKTGRLVAMSAELGSIIANADSEHRQALATYASSVGRAFQIQDDLLDVVAEEQRFGKTIGGDIVAGKKTYLLVQALTRATGEDHNVLKSVVPGSNDHDRVVERVSNIYHRLGVIDMARDQIRNDTDRARVACGLLPASEARDMLVWFAEELLERTH